MKYYAVPYYCVCPEFCCRRDTDAVCEHTKACAAKIENEYPAEGLEEGEVLIAAYVGYPQVYVIIDKNALFEVSEEFNDVMAGPPFENLFKEKYTNEMSARSKYKSRYLSIDLKKKYGIGYYGYGTLVDGYSGHSGFKIK